VWFKADLDFNLHQKELIEARFTELSPFLDILSLTLTHFCHHHGKALMTASQKDAA
jgi:hypothetical protein